MKRTIVLKYGTLLCSAPSSLSYMQHARPNTNTGTRVLHLNVSGSGVLLLHHYIQWHARQTGIKNRVSSEEGIPCKKAIPTACVIRYPSSRSSQESPTLPYSVHKNTFHCSNSSCLWDTSGSLMPHLKSVMSASMLSIHIHLWSHVLLKLSTPLFPASNKQGMVKHKTAQCGAVSYC